MPRLIDYDDKDLWYETEHIAGTEPLSNRLVTLPSNQVDAVVSDLIRIDRQLYRNRIDYRAISIDHILIGENGEAYLTGFARSRINHALEDILFDSVWVHSPRILVIRGWQTHLRQLWQFGVMRSIACRSVRHAVRSTNCFVVVISEGLNTDGT